MGAVGHGISRLVAVDSSSYNWFYSISSCEACLRLSLQTYSAELVSISETSQVSECDCTKGHQRDKFCKKLWKKKIVLLQNCYTNYKQ